MQKSSAYTECAGQTANAISWLDWSAEVWDTSPAASVIGTAATEQLGVKSVDEDRTQAEADAQQAQKSRRTNYAHTHTHTRQFQQTCTK